VFEYTCFLHPQQKSTDLDDRCPECGEKYGFPLESANLPAEINNKTVKRALNRGFYGAVYETGHPRTGRRYAVKIIPMATYAPRSEGGYGKSFEVERNLHLALSSAAVVAKLEDWGEGTFRFGAHEIRCYWMEMEFVEGRTLDEVIAEGPSSPRAVAQIAWDLLDVVEAFQQRDYHHNDFHGKNIIITTLAASEARLRAIEPHTGIKVLDIGSAAPETKSSDARYGDTHWVARHILALLDSYERRSRDADPASLRTCAQLRRVAEYYHGIDKTRLPSTRDIKEQVRSAYNYAQRPWDEPIRLPSVSTHYNAKTLPPRFAPELLYDPDGKWARRLIGVGPQLLFGMRGCGKTILLRSLEWAARLQPRRDPAGSIETRAQLIARVAEEPFVGLFVSCSALLRGPKPELVDAPVARTFLAFAREIVRGVEASALTEIGSVNYGELRPFADLVARMVPWFTPPLDGAHIWELSRSLSEALSSSVNGHGVETELAPLVMFEELARSTRSLVDIWAKKVLLFLLDDVSTRVLQLQNVNDLMSQLCIQSPLFGFKISTESQTVELRTEGGGPALSGRDFKPFDLGSDVLAHLGGREGARFVGTILERRAAITDAAPTQAAKDILGSQTMEHLATTIRTSSAGTAVYWGLETLSGMCVGDIGDILQLYETILDRGAGKPLPIAKEIQHKAAIELAESKLRSLAMRKEWLYSHAIAFAQASHRELKRSGGRNRQFTRIHINIDPGDAEQFFPRILELVDAGVFVFIGGQARSKGGGAGPVLQFKLAYRKLLGLPSRLPLSDRERFEPETASELAEWLMNPKSAALRWGNLPANGNEHERNENGTSSENAGSTPTQHVISFSRSARQHSDDPEWPKVHALHEVVAEEDGDLPAVEIDWTTKHVIGAFGFEERSLGAWQALLKRGVPRRSTLIKYPDPGRRVEIEQVLRQAGALYTAENVTSHDRSALVSTLIGRCQDDTDIVIDTTALTKALIYELVSEVLTQRGHAWILHTCAAEYFPPADKLRQVVARLPTEILAIRELDALMEGESGPYRTEQIGPVSRDPSQPSVLVAFVPLKHARLAKLLEEIPVEMIVAIIPLHSDGRSSPRTIAAEYLADHLIQQFGGEKRFVRSLDHMEAYQTLVEFHVKYGLEGGYNFELSLTGTKMHAVAAGMLAATTRLAGVFYSAPRQFIHEKFTAGVGSTRVSHLRRRETRPTRD